MIENKETGKYQVLCFESGRQATLRLPVTVPRRWKTSAEALLGGPTRCGAHPQYPCYRVRGINDVTATLTYDPMFRYQHSRCLNSIQASH